MSKKYIAPSELPINKDGSVFHLHVKPNQLAHKIILVGDPGRVTTVAKHFDQIECDVQSREFHTITGTYQSKRISCVSTGIGCDNIDIVMTELDALVNVDFTTREVKDEIKQLEIVRIGTSGGLQSNTPVGTYVCSARSIGFDGVLNFYAGRNAICNLPMERAFINHMGWSGTLCAPAAYAIHADEELVSRIAANDMVRGITIAGNGFYGPQGRDVRISPADPQQNAKIETFEYDGLHVTNFEMESSAVAGLGKLMGHKATTVCLIIANRIAKEMNTSPKTVRRAEEFVNGMDAAEEVLPGISKEIISGNIKPNKADVRAIGKAPINERKQMAERLYKPLTPEEKEKRRKKRDFMKSLAMLDATHRPSPTNKIQPEDMLMTFSSEAEKFVRSMDFCFDYFPQLLTEPEYFEQVKKSNSAGKRLYKNFGGKQAFT